MFDESKHWTKPLEQAIKKVILRDQTVKLYIWIDGDKVEYASDV